MHILDEAQTLFAGERPRLQCSTGHDAESGGVEEGNSLPKDDTVTDEGVKTESLVKNRQWQRVSTCLKNEPSH